MPEPITKPAMPAYGPLFGQVTAQPRFGATGFGQTPGKDEILGGGVQPKGDGPKITTGEDKVEIKGPDGGKDPAPETETAESFNQGSGKGNLKYKLGFLLADILPFLAGFISIGTGPVGWLMFPAVWLASFGISRVGRRLKEGVNEQELTGLAARVVKMKALFKNPQMVKNGSALGALEGTAGVMLNPLLATVRSFPGGNWALGKVGLQEGLKLSTTSGIGRFITNRAFERAMIFDTAAEQDNIFKAIGASGKVGGLLFLGNAIMKLSNSAPGPFKWIFKLLGFALPWLGMAGKKTEEPPQNGTQPPQK